MTHPRINAKKWIATLLLASTTLAMASCSASKADGGMNGLYYPTAGSPTSSSGENYTEIVENAFVSTDEQNTSYFSIDANTASYPNLRSLIRNGYSIPKDAVRVEEMLNYFRYDYTTPTDGSVLALTSSVFDTPYNSETKLLTIGLAAQKVEFSEIKNNIVFLIDTSGSMFSADKLQLVQTAFMMMVENLNPEDRVSIVTYAGSETVALRGAYGYEKQKIMAVIEDLQAGGSTAGSDGIYTAYNIAEECFIEGGNNRIILATDGDFNVGITSVPKLKSLIAEKRETGVYFSVFGVGRGNVQSETMEALALSGNGTYSYIDSPKEARRALVEEIGGTMVTVAKDVKAGVIFNTEYVESFRLIGYENKLLTEEEFNDSNTDAGELGSGHTVTVVYEIVLKDKELSPDDHLAQVTVKYKPTENVGGNTDKEEKSLLMDIKCSDYHSNPTANDAFVASVVEFALILRNSEYKKDASPQSLIARLEDLDLSEDEFKAEFRDLVKEHLGKVK